MAFGYFPDERFVNALPEEFDAPSIAIFFELILIKRSLSFVLLGYKLT